MHVSLRIYAYRVLSGNVGGVDICYCSCQSPILLVILSVHTSIVLYYLQGVPLHIYRVHMTVYMYYLQYVHAYSTNVCVDICLKRICIYTNIIVSCAYMHLSHLLPLCTVHLVNNLGIRLCPIFLILSSPPPFHFVLFRSYIMYSVKLARYLT